MSPHPRAVQPSPPRPAAYGGPEGRLCLLVAIDPQDAALHRPLSYLPPEDGPLPEVGMPVRVPLQRRSVRGWVVGTGPGPAGVRLRHVLAVGRPSDRCPLDLLDLGAWLAERYLASHGAALSVLVPPPAPVRATQGSSRRTEGSPPCPQATRGQLPALTPAQSEAASAIGRSVDEASHQVFLLWGVTASGKTRVYEESIARCLAGGRTALVLVPEIALTGQMVRALVSRFGETVAVLHSQMSASARRAQWDDVASGRARVVVGARSAVFAPADRLGLVIVDEEHEASYKQDEAPRYHAREVALERARRSQAVAVLGSATPSLESIWRALQGIYRLLRLPERVDRRPMPQVEVVDLREELAAAGTVSPLSRPLRDALREVLGRRQQAILFVNRRGFSGAMLCRECGYAWRCPHCDVALTYHHSAEGRVLRCHYCGFSTPMPALCPRCGGRDVAPVGFGTQKLQATLAQAFPGVAILRLDADTTTRRSSHERILGEFARTFPAILVGTQMVAKGHDFAGVTLGAAVLPDVTLHLPDFRSAERAFQQLVQVAGRAGRGEIPGRVIIQTFQPQHHSVQAAAHGTAEEFFERELAFRRRLGYPPFGELVRVVASDPDEAKARRSAADIARRLEEARGVEVRVLGPSPAPLARLRDRFRWQVMVRGPAPEARRLVGGLLEEGITGGALRVENVAVDVDPESVL